MNGYRLTLRVPLCIVIFVAFSALAHAQATRTWVSGVGDDVNPCSRTAPCKTFAGAISKTAVGGEINVIDPGGFGAVTITKSITIDGAGTLASILGSSTNGIIVNITSAEDTARSVRIRGLSLNGAGNGLQGIKVIAVNKLIVEDTVIDNFTDGINVASPADVQVFVKDTTISNNRGAGINIESGGKVIMSGVTVIFNNTGLAVTGGGSIDSFGNNIIYGNEKDGDPPASVEQR